MKKNFNKKLVLKKHTMARLDAEKLKELYGGARITPGPKPEPTMDGKITCVCDTREHC